MFSLYPLLTHAPTSFGRILQQRPCSYFIFCYGLKMSALKYLIVFLHTLKTARLVITMEIRDRLACCPVRGQLIIVPLALWSPTSEWWHTGSGYLGPKASLHEIRACAGSLFSCLQWVFQHLVGWQLSPVEVASQLCCLPDRLALEVAQGIPGLSSSLFQHQDHLTHVHVIVKYICSVLSLHFIDL